VLPGGSLLRLGGTGRPPAERWSAARGGDRPQPRGAAAGQGSLIACKLHSSRLFGRLVQAGPLMAETWPRKHLWRAGFHEGEWAFRAHRELRGMLRRVNAGSGTRQTPVGRAERAGVDGVLEACVLCFCSATWRGARATGPRAGRVGSTGWKMRIGGGGNGWFRAGRDRDGASRQGAGRAQGRGGTGTHGINARVAGVTWTETGPTRRVERGGWGRLPRDGEPELGDTRWPARAAGIAGVIMDRGLPGGLRVVRAYTRLERGRTC